MKAKILTLAAISAVLFAPAALAQSAGAGSNGGSTSGAGGSSVSGSSSSTASVHTSGNAGVGITQGTVAEGGHASSSSGAAQGTGSGGTSSTQETVADQAPSAVNEGVVSQLDLPAIGTIEDAVPASGTWRDMVTYAVIALLVAGLAVLYRRLPRPSRA